MIVRLTYFRAFGRFISECAYRTQLTALHEIWAEIKTMQLEGRLPGLAPGAGSGSDGHEAYLILVDVPDHARPCPRVIMRRD